ncbi:MAG TPA: YjgN family protein [Syntrophorhabdaceae bacterium]|jgi:uncharacterized membrane protein YjgN (DUF898 family)
MNDYLDGGVVPAASVDLEASVPEENEAVRYPFRFEGTGKEYFRIWIVNVFLTIITLGIYAAWAKVRTRQYFYNNTHLADHSFEFLGNPLTILKGNLIVGAGAVLYYVLKNVLPVYTLYIVAAFYIFLPYLIYKSLRFNARNSSYRNIRFHFVGTLKESYFVYLLCPLFIPLSLGFFYPAWIYLKKNYFFDNLTYGAAKNDFNGRVGPFYRAYSIVLLFPVFVPIAGFAIVMAMPFIGPLLRRAGTTDHLIWLVPLALSLGWFTGYIFLKQYFYVRLNNYCFAQSAIGGAALESTMQVGRLTWIYFTNILAIIFSLGLLIPWAKVRRTRYILENLAVVTSFGLEDFAARAEEDVGAVGDAATDIFDIAVGL